MKNPSFVVELNLWQFIALFKGLHGFPPCAMVGRAILTKDCAMDLSGKTVLITGASRGIGEASVAEFADTGQSCVNRAVKGRD